MSQTRTDQRQQTAGADLRQEGMPAGQSPAVQEQRRPLTAVERAQQAAWASYNKITAAVADRRSDFEKLLAPFGVSFDFFEAGLQIGLRKAMKSDRDFFDPDRGVHPVNVIEAAFALARMGLIADGREAAIVRYDRDAQPMPMVEGYVKILHETGIVKDINHDVVIMGDPFDYRQGDEGFIDHRPSLERDTDGEIVGAWCIVTTTLGGRYAEVTPKKDLDRIASTSRAKNGPRSKWGAEMARKAPFRRLVKRLPRTKGLSDLSAARLTALVDADDRNFDLTKPTDQIGERAATAKRMSHAELYEDTAAKLPVEEDEPEDTSTPQLPDPTRGLDAVDPEVLASLERVIGAADTDADLDDAVMTIRTGAHWHHFKPEVHDYLLNLAAERRQQLAGPPGLQAIISSTDKSPRSYAEPKVWADNLLAKMSAVQGKSLAAFWDRNKAFVTSATKLEHASAEAQRVLQVAIARGVHKEGEDADA